MTTTVRIALSPQRAAAFTLLELLVASVVFIVMVALVLQVSNGVNQTSQHQYRKMDTAASSRIALDTLSQDIGTLVTRGGATLLFKPGDETSSDQLRFLCFSRPMSEFPDARMSIVSYQIDTRPHPDMEMSIPMLVRGNAPVFWAKNASGEEYRFPELLANRQLTYSDIASERVFRFQIVWIRQDGQITHDPRGASPDDSEMREDSDGFIWIDLKEVRGFIVSVAAIDLPAQKRVTDFAAIQRQLIAIHSTEETPQDVPAAEWNALADRITPETLRASLHFSQRTYFFFR